MKKYISPINKVIGIQPEMLIADSDGFEKPNDKQGFGTTGGFVKAERGFEEGSGWENTGW